AAAVVGAPSQTAPPFFAAGRYQVLSVLGQGGMGAVYEVLDTQLGRTVALKTILPQFLTDGQAAARFEREARALARLNHPNILAVHDYGQDAATGDIYLVMELGGPDLGQLLEFAAGPLPLEQSITI